MEKIACEKIGGIAPGNPLRVKEKRIKKVIVEMSMKLPVRADKLYRSSSTD
jgi:hypothetical protein